VRQRSSRAGVLFLLAVASRGILGAAAAIYFFRGFMIVFVFSTYLNEI
jgi:hypothetical protein